MNWKTHTIAARTIALLILTGGVFSAHGQTGLCSSTAGPGKQWSGQLTSVWGDIITNVSVSFGANQSFSYEVAFGSTTILKAEGVFTMQQSNEKADRWPSACLISFHPTNIEVRPQSADLAALNDRALFNGLPQTYRIDHSYGTGETMLLLEVSQPPTSTFDMYFQLKASSTPTHSLVLATASPAPVHEQPPDSHNLKWVFTIKLTEQNGVATKLTDFSIDGQSYASKITAYFGTANLSAKGMIFASLGYSQLTVPSTHTFVFTGIDADGSQWSQKLALQFIGAATSSSISINSVLNAASFQTTFAPGMILSVFGSELSSSTAAASAVPLPMSLGGASATVNGLSAPFYYASPGQLNIQLPYETKIGPATLTVTRGGQTASYSLTVAATAPGIFVDAKSSLVPAASAKRGSTVTLFLTGSGVMSPAIATGAAPTPGTSISQLPHPQAPVTVTVGGVAATIAFVGTPIGLVGTTQVNFIVPETLPAIPLSVQVTVGGETSGKAILSVN